MTSFAQMADVLVAHRAAPALTVSCQASINRCNGKTKALRMALEQGCFSAQELARIASLRNSGLVYALLKVDMQKGLVVLEDGIYRRALA